MIRSEGYGTSGYELGRQLFRDWADQASHSSTESSLIFIIWLEYLGTSPVCGLVPGQQSIGSVWLINFGWSYKVRSDGYAVSG
jgi:hypothetical protein